MDLTTLLTDDIQAAFSSGQVLSTITFDVEGGFDTVLPNRLTGHLMQQHRPINLISWVQSFLTGRAASIQLDGITGQPFPLAGSLPQGSPVSPILFHALLAPFIHIANSLQHFISERVCSRWQSCSQVRQLS